MTDACDLRSIREIAREVFGDATQVAVERVGDGISTLVYRLRRGKETFYLRVLPEIGDSFGRGIRAGNADCTCSNHVPLGP